MTPAELERITESVGGPRALASLRSLLGQLDDARVEVEDLSIHAPDLDDVFFAVTGHPTAQPTTEEALAR